MREAMSGPVQISSKSCSSPRLISTPPGASLSRQKTLRPLRAASVAAVRPAGPAPMTITSYAGVSIANSLPIDSGGFHT